MTEEVCDTQYEAVNWGFGELLWFRSANAAIGLCLVPPQPLAVRRAPPRRGPAVLNVLEDHGRLEN
jgi:hypothetical protein